MLSRPRLFRIISLLAIFLNGSSTVRPQDVVSVPKDGTFARMVIIRPKAGQVPAFEAGYKRHLEWHRAQRDTWTWYGWTFVLGERLGLFMDGTFGHAVTDFDAAVNPPEDAADNSNNVTPNADFLSHGVYERLDKMSRGTRLPDTSPFLALHTYQVVPGQEPAFESALASALENLSAKHFTCYRLRIGGSSPQYVLMRSASSFAAATALSDVSLPPGLVGQTQSELLRFRPGLSYQP